MADARLYDAGIGQSTHPWPSSIRFRYRAGAAMRARRCATLSIAASQLPVLVGASAHGSSLPDVAASWWHAARPGHALTAGYGLAALAVLWLARRYGPRGLPSIMSGSRARLVIRLVPLAVLLAAMAAAGGL